MEQTRNNALSHLPSGWLLFTFTIHYSLFTIHYLITSRHISLLVALILTLIPEATMADDDTELSVSLVANASSGDFAPYFIGALNHGKITQKNSCLTDASLIKGMNDDSRFSWGFGVEMLGGTSSENVYQKWDAETQAWIDNPQRPASVWLQQLYGEVRYRKIFVSAGLKEHDPALLNPQLSSGDFIESGNARPIPELRGGFYDFVDIPLTNGWVQMQCQLSYGPTLDNKFNENHYNYYTYHIAKNSIYSYKFCYFRSNPDQRLIVTAGMQAGAFFGGSADYYSDGKFLYTNEYKSDLGSYINMIIPVMKKSETFVQGSSIGSWDFYAQYLLNSGSEVAAYFQWPFEDGSGIARRNKIDGIWGLEYNSNARTPISQVVVEYIDFRDQSGPIHFAPEDYNHPTLTNGVSGRDDYYNNGFYNAYAYYGMSIGTPFLVAPIYNLDGYPAYTANRANGVHLGMSGYLSDALQYRLLFGYQRSLGTYNGPFTEPRTDTSFMLEGKYRRGKFNFKAQIAMDRGTLRGNNFGALIGVTYNSKL